MVFLFTIVFILTYYFSILTYFLQFSTDCQELLIPLFKQVIGVIKQGDKDIHIEIRRAIEEDYKNLYTGIIWDNNIGVHGVHNFLYKDLDSLYKDIHKFLVNDLLSK
jgi:hypothetical protein